MADRIDEDYGRELQKEARAERQADLKAAGDLLSPAQQKDLKNFLVNDCWMKPAEAQDVMDTINSLAGDVGVKTNSGFRQPTIAEQVKGVVHDALQGHVKDKFLNNDDNFKPITGMLTQAVEAREAKIAALHQPAGTTQTANVSVSAPKAGR